MNEQKQGILIGIGLTITALYIFGFFSSFQASPKQVQKQAQQTGLNQLLDEPLGLHADVRQNRSKRNKKSQIGKQWGVALKNMMENKGSNKKVMTGSKTTDPQTEKTTNKKNKKEDKQTEENADKNTDGTDNSYYADAIKEQKTNEDLGIAGISGNFALPYTTDRNDPQSLDTIDEWIAYFINTNSLSSTDKLVNAKRSKEISEDLFYSVVEELIANFRDKLKRYGIIILNKTPSLESFHRLVRISENRNHEHEQDIQNSIENALQQYMNINHIQVLIDAVNSQEDNTKLKAIEISISSAQINLRGGQNIDHSIDQAGQQLQPQTVHFDRKRIIYGSLKMALENVAQKDHNQKVRQRAEEAARIIGELLQSQNVIFQTSTSQ